MKMYLLVVGAVMAAILGLAEPLWAQYTVTPSQGQVYWTGGSFIASSTSTSAVATSASALSDNVIRIWSQVFYPGGFSFVPFPDAPTYFVDVNQDADGVFDVTGQCGFSNSIQVAGSYYASTAAQFPLQAQGNMVPGGGGGGTNGTTQLWHWATNTASSVTVNLVIHDSFKGDGSTPVIGDPIARELQNDKRGAFGIANLDQNILTNGKCLIMLEIKNPTNQSLAGSVHLTITGDGTNVNVRDNSKSLTNTRDWTISSLPVTLFIEGLTYSNNVRDITAEIKDDNNNSLDKAMMTFIWAKYVVGNCECSVDGNGNNVPANQVAAALGAANGNITDPPLTWLNQFGSTGILGIPTGYPVVGVHNVHVTKATIYPTRKAADWKTDGVMFDVTRQAAFSKWQTDLLPDWGPVDVVSTIPNQDEGSNDDSSGLFPDKSTAPTDSGEMFYIDGPGTKIARPVPNLSLANRALRFTFNEFVHVRFDGTRPKGGLQNRDGVVVNGARCSAKFGWHCRHTLNSVGGANYTRVAGTPNDIGPPFMAIAVP